MSHKKAKLERRSKPKGRHYQFRAGGYDTVLVEINKSTHTIVKTYEDDSRVVVAVAPLDKVTVRPPQPSTPSYEEVAAAYKRASEGNAEPQCLGVVGSDTDVENVVKFVEAANEPQR